MSTTLTAGGRHLAILSSVIAGTWPADKSGALPRSFRILKRGDNQSTKGNFKVTETTDSELEANQRALGFERVAIDYNHCTVPDSPEYVKGQPAAVLGYCDIRVRPDGVSAENVEWTPLGEKVARNFEDISPALSTDPNGSVTFIHSIAMTPNGCLTDSQLRDLINNSVSLQRRAAGQSQELRGRARIIAALNSSVPTRLHTNSAETANRSVAFTSSGIPEIMADPGLLPDTLLIWPWGSAQGPLSYLVVNEQTAADAPKYAKTFNRERVPIVIPATGGDEKSPTIPAHLAGDGDLVVKPGEGISLANIKWTDEGRRQILHFSGLRPEFLMGKDNCVAGLLAVTLAQADGGAGFTPLPRFLTVNAAHAKKPLRGYARMVAGFHQENLVRLQAERAARQDAPGETKEDLVDCLFTLHSPINPTTGVPFTVVQLSAMDMSGLRALQANTPRKVRGANFMRYAQERQNRRDKPSAALSLLHCGEVGQDKIIDLLLASRDTVNPDTGRPYTREQLAAQPQALLQFLLLNAPRKLHGRDLFLFAQEQQNLSQGSLTNRD